MLNIEKSQYPIGKHTPKNKKIIDCISDIKNFPNKVIIETENLSKQELNYKYRLKGWTIKQVIGHCVDSHLNSFIRFKLALTENNPTIRPYNETKWAELPDTLNYDVFENLELLKNIHKRWVYLLENLSKTDLNKTFIHPDGNEVISLKENITIYAWHCNHHLAHIINAKKHQF